MLVKDSPTLSARCHGNSPMTTKEIQIVEGNDREYVDDALHLTFEAFAKKFRIGFRNADDFVRLFRDSVDPENCLFAIVDGELWGVLAFKTTGHEFYQLNLKTPFERFSPFRAGLILFNLILLDLEDAVRADEFHIDVLAVVPFSRGMGIGTALIQKAEVKAESGGKRMMSLGVIAENDGAIRLYERLGYRTTRTWRGFLVRLSAKSKEVRRMEKPLTGELPDDEDGSVA